VVVLVKDDNKGRLEDKEEYRNGHVLIFLEFGDLFEEKPHGSNKSKADKESAQVFGSECTKEFCYGRCC